MKIFEIKLSSWINHLVTIVALGNLIFIIGTQLFPDTAFTLIIFVVGIIFILYYVPQYTATAHTIWTITQSSIHVKWTKPALFHRPKPDVLVMWEEIQAYQLGGDKVFDRFKLVLKDGTVLKYWHNNLITADDFDKFISNFIERVEEHNKKEIEKEITDKIASN